MPIIHVMHNTEPEAKTKPPLMSTCMQKRLFSTMSAYNLPCCTSHSIIVVYLLINALYMQKTECLALLVYVELI